MKKYILSCFLILCSCSLFAQDKEAIIRVLERQQKAWNKGSIEKFMDGYWKSDSLIFVGSAAPTYGWQAALDHYNGRYPDKSFMGTLTFTIIKVDVIDKTNAFVLGAWNLKREKDSPGGYFTLWFKKIKGDWVIVVDHTS
jgi:ketosteroid isomerase-like protein